MKVSVGFLRKMIREALEEAEGEEPAPAAQWVELPDASFDVKIDKFLVDAESNDDIDESFIWEAEEESPDDDPAAAEDETSTLPADQPEQKLDVGKVSREISRLIDNFDNLIDVKGLVLRRALNYVGQKYGKEQANQVRDVLETQFGLHLSDEEESPVAPPADRAGPALAG